jgi:hypothetical protein
MITRIGKRSWGLAVFSPFILVFSGGCNPTPPPPRVPVPATSNQDVILRRDYLKPMPPRDERVDTRVQSNVREIPYEAATRPTRAEPHDQASKVRADFADAYQKVGRPRIVVLAFRDDGAGPAPDLTAVEDSLAKQFECDKQVTVTPPKIAREKLTDAQIKDLEAGRPEALGAVDSSLNGDILIQLRFVPKPQGALSSRLTAEAVNVRGGDVIGRAEVDVDRPNDKAQVEDATHYVTQKLMIDMLQAWTAPQPR